MTKNILLIILVLTIFYGHGICQTKIKKIKDPYLKDTWEEICVLKANQEIREGTYKRIISGVLSVEGNYKSGKRSGVWKIYNYNNEVETEINFDSGLIQYVSKDSLSNKQTLIETQLYPTSDRPLINLTSSIMLTYYLASLLNYPTYAQENGISGQVVILVKVNSQGVIIDYVVSTSVDKSLDEEAMRVIKMLPLELLPAYKNGKPIESELKVPVKFSLF